MSVIFQNQKVVLENFEIDLKSGIVYYKLPKPVERIEFKVRITRDGVEMIPLDENEITIHNMKPESD